MAKDKKKSKVAVKVKKQEKQERKQQKREKKVTIKSKRRQADVEESEEEDIELLLEAFKEKQEERYKITEEVIASTPSRRANATLTINPLNLNELILFGGEFYDGASCIFYNDLFRYNIERNEWKKITSPHSPGPRSSHQIVITPTGLVFLFGGEFASKNETQFFHYKDFWVFDLKSNIWEQLELKVRPSPRSGHRMCLWKHYIVLFGGFYDTYVQTKYFDDLWLFDLQEYKWIAVDISSILPKPLPRSGFQMFAFNDLVYLYGGYYKQCLKGQRAKGIVHTDLWALKMSTDTKLLRWEKKKKQGFYPGPRAGATMALYKSKSVLFGGVSDEETPEEGMISTCYNDMFVFQVESSKWYSLAVRAKTQPKQRRKEKKKEEKVSETATDYSDNNDTYHTYDDDDDENEETVTISRPLQTILPSAELPSKSKIIAPSPRFNSMMVVSKNMLYLYGGILDADGKEYTLDDLWSLNLDKVDGWKCVDEGEGLGEWLGEESDDDEDDDDEEDTDDDDDDEYSSEEENKVGRDGSIGKLDHDIITESVNDDVLEQKEKEIFDFSNQKKKVKAKKLEGNHDDITPRQDGSNTDVKKVEKKSKGKAKKRSKDDGQEYEGDEEHKAMQEKEAELKKLLEENQNAPRPSESLKDYYVRTASFWVNRAFNEGENDNTGKSLRKDAFAVCRERYMEWQPMLAELRKLEVDLEDAAPLKGVTEKIVVGRNRR